MDDQALSQGFGSSSLTRAQWTPEAHVRTAFSYARQHTGLAAFGISLLFQS